MTEPMSETELRSPESNPPPQRVVPANWLAESLSSLCFARPALDRLGEPVPGLVFGLLVD